LRLTRLRRQRPGKRLSFGAVSHILDFRDAPTSPDGDAAFPAGDATPTPGRCAHRPLEMYYLLEICTSPTKNVASPAGNVASSSGDVRASPKFRICDIAGYCIFAFVYFVFPLYFVAR